MEWSRVKILPFIECYRTKTILWDPQHPEHYNKLKRRDVWQQLAEEFEISTEECKKKITSLLASLRREKAKVKKTKRSETGTEEVYTSSWFAFKALEFLLDRNKPRSTLDTISTNAETTERKTEQPNEDDQPNKNKTTPARDESRPHRCKKAKRDVNTPEETEQPNEDDKKTENKTAPVRDESRPPRYKKTKRDVNTSEETEQPNEDDQKTKNETTLDRDEPNEDDKKTKNETTPDRNESRPPRCKKVKRDVNTPEEMMTSAFAILNNAAQKNETLAECNSFGRFFSNKLKNYSRVTRNAVQHSISNILFDADQGRFEIMYPRMEKTYGQAQLQAVGSHSSFSTHPSIPFTSTQTKSQHTLQPTSSPQESQGIEDEFSDLLN